MKRISKSFALLCMGLLAVACVEENFEPNIGSYDTAPGNDIQFSAMAKVNNGNIQTKTEYGDVGTVDGEQYIEVNWSEGDKITIASPEATGTNIAHYDIGFNADVDGNYSGSHAATVTKRGGVGLQWSESDNYTFFAMYPMLDTTDEDKDFNGRYELVLGDNGTPAVLNGYLPVAQNPKSISSDGTNYVVAPDMRYAYMVAYDEFDRTPGEDDKVDPISLSFKSLSTVLQFELTAGSISNQAQDQIKINSVSLLSEKGNPICGPFKYTYPDEEGSSGNAVFDMEAAGGASASSFSRLTMDFSSLGSDIILKSGGKLDLTFFLLPIVDFDKGTKDLKLQIFYEVNGTTQYMTATLGVDIDASRKYYFKGLKMKDIVTKVDGSQWISALAPNIYISQLSIPVAGNAFTYFYDGDNPQYFKEQTQNFMDLWNKGVRGFEFCTAIGWNQSTAQGDYNTNSAPKTLESEYFVCNGNEIFATESNGAPTFGQAFRALAAMLEKEEYKNECLFIIATYKSFGGDGGFRPQVYLTDLDNFINANESIKNRLVKLDPGSTVKSLRGKIAIIVRLADDDYVSYASSTTNANSISNAVAGLANRDKLTIVKNWGTSPDCWDRRFGSNYARQMVFGRGGTYVEDNLWGVSTSASQFSVYKDSGSGILGSWSFDGSFKTGYPNNTQFDCSFDTYTSGQTMHIHEWARVISTEMGGAEMYTNSSSGSYYLWVKWPESFSQKKLNIDHTFNAANATKGGTSSNTLFINSLCGYYATDKLQNTFVAGNYKTSILPYAGNYEVRTGRWSTRDLSCNHAGNGGDIAGLAADLNVYFWNKMKNVDGTTEQGPLGFVMMNYIASSVDDFKNSPLVGTGNHVSAQDAEKASEELPNMILMNNFKFPLAQAPADPDITTSGTVTVSDFDNIYLNGGKAISFE